MIRTIEPPSLLENFTEIVIERLNITLLSNVLDWKELKREQVYKNLVDIMAHGL
jgi:hypothetical protein